MRATASGDFWAVEEYRPSLVHVDGDGIHTTPKQRLRGARRDARQRDAIHRPSEPAGAPHAIDWARLQDFCLVDETTFDAEGNLTNNDTGVRSRII